MKANQRSVRAFRHSVALILSSAATHGIDLVDVVFEPPFGSTDIIECSIVLADLVVSVMIRHSVALILSSAADEERVYSILLKTPPFGSTDIIECSFHRTQLVADLRPPPFGSTDIIECSMLPFGGVAGKPVRHSVALILSSAAARQYSNGGNTRPAIR